MRERLYATWNNIRQRCENPNRKDYRWYGGRGVSVCEEWKKYSAFKSWALRNGYQDDLTIDRIDVSKGYAPDNCRWIPFKEQRENTSQTHKVTINDETKSVKAWCDLYGISYDMVIMRIHRGMDEVSALLTPTKRRRDS